MRGTRLQEERRFGNREALLLPMSADHRFFSHAARWPTIFYLIVPLAAQAALVFNGVVTLSFVASTRLRPAMADLGGGVAVIMLVVPVLIVWLKLFAAHRRRMSVRWPVLGVLAGAALAAALKLQVALLPPGTSGQIGVTRSAPWPLPQLVLALLSLGLLIWIGFSIAVVIVDFNSSGRWWQRNIK